jgi:hypothetical protein
MACFRSGQRCKMLRKLGMMGNKNIVSEMHTTAINLASKKTSYGC